MAYVKAQHVAMLIGLYLLRCYEVWRIVSEDSSYQLLRLRLTITHKKSFLLIVWFASCCKANTLRIFAWQNHSRLCLKHLRILQMFQHIARFSFNLLGIQKE